MTVPTRFLGHSAVRPDIHESESISETDEGFWPWDSLATPGNPVVIDDAMHRIAASEEVTDAEFGKVGREMSMAAQLPRGPGRMRPPAARARKTILLVDDEAELRHVLRLALEEHGYSVLEATCGREALDALRQHVLDLVVADAMLPDIHGFDIAKRMKGTERYGNIPIVLMSDVHHGWRFAEVLRAGYGVQSYIEKPFKVADLLAVVQAAFEHRSPAGNVETISKEAERMLTMGIEAYQKGKIDEAVVHLRDGTRIDPLAYRLHFHLGLLYGKLDKIFDAIQELESAVAINGRHYAALKNLAVLYQKAGFRNKAIEAWEQALDVAPDEATRQSIKEHLVGLL